MTKPQKENRPNRNEVYYIIRNLIDSCFCTGTANKEAKIATDKIMEIFKKKYGQ